MEDFSQYKIKEWNHPLSIKNYSRRGDTIAPSSEEIAFYTKYLNRIKAKVGEPKMLILGATSELRDLGLKLGFEVFAVDMNVKMITLANRFLTIKDRRKEKVIQADWLEVFLQNNFFAAVLGDVSLNNVSASALPELMEKIYSWLKPGGSLLIRNFVLPAAEKDITDIKNDLAAWRQKKIGFREFYFRYRVGHCFACCYDKENKIFDAAKEYLWLDQLYQTGLFTKAEYGELNLRRSVYRHTVLLINDFLTIFSQYFKVIEISAEVPENVGFYPVKLFAGEKNVKA